MSQDTESGGKPTPASPTVNATMDPNPWIINGWKDSLLFVMSPVLIIPLLVFPLLHLYRAGSIDDVILLAMAALIATGHHLPGFLRVYGDRAIFRAHRWRLLAAPLFLLAICLSFSTRNLESLALVLLIWGFWHNLRQTYGFARIYDAKIGSLARSTIDLDFLMCFTWFGLGVVLSPGRLEQLLQIFYVAGGPLIPPSWFLGLKILWVMMTAVLSFAFIANYIVQRRHGQEANLVKLLVMASSIGFWWFTMVTIREILIGILVFELFHAIQSVAIDWVFLRRRVDSGGELAGIVRVLFGRNLLVVFVFLLLTVLYGVPIGVAYYMAPGFGSDTSANLAYRLIYGLTAASTLLHFYYQGFVWRIREPENRTVLAIPDAGPGVAPAWLIPTRIPHLLGWGVFVVLVGILGNMEWKSAGPTPGMYENLVEVVPSHWRPHQQLGERLLADGQTALAAESFDTAITLNPQRAELHVLFGQAVLLLGQVESAVESFEKATTLRPDLPQAHQELGKSLFARGELDAGLEHLRKAVELDPSNALTSYELGRAQAEIARLGDPDSRDFSDALKSFNRSIELDASFAPAYNARGVIQWNLQRFDDAITDLDHAIRLDPTLAKAYRNRAGVWISLAQPEKAVQDLSNAIKHHGYDSTDFVRRGDLYYNMQEYEKAAADYAMAVRIEQVFIEPLRRYIGLLTTCPDEKYRDYRLAIDLAHAACRRADWKSVEALELLALTHGVAGEFDQAIRWQEQAIAIAPDELKEEMQKVMAQFTQRKKNVEEAASQKTEPKATKEPTNREPEDQSAAPKNVAPKSGS